LRAVPELYEWGCGFGEDNHGLGSNLGDAGGDGKGFGNARSTGDADRAAGTQGGNHGHVTGEDAEVASFTSDGDRGSFGFSQLLRGGKERELHGGTL